MLDVKPQVVSALSQVLPTSYELFDEESTLPCITYYEYINNDDKTGDTFGYSTIGITVTLWTTTLSDQATYMKQIDSKMRDLGFKRVGGNEMVENNIYRKIIDYKGLAIETY